MRHPRRISVSVSEHTYERLRERAHQQHSSISALVRGLLAEAATRPSTPKTIPAPANEPPPISPAAPPGPRPQHISPPKGYAPEPFSLVCPDRVNHVNGIYCPHCKGNRSSR